MTPHPQKHCDHECVCAYYVTDRKPCTDENQYPANKCPHDTRCASHSSAPTGRDKVLDILTLIELWISDYQDLNGNGEIDPEQLRDMLESFRTHPEAP